MGSHRIVARSSLNTSPTLSHTRRSSYIPAAHHEPRKRAQVLLPSRVRILAHPHQLARPDDSSMLGDEGPQLAGEVDGPVGFHACWAVRGRVEESEATLENASRKFGKKSPSTSPTFVLDRFPNRAPPTCHHLPPRCGLTAHHVRARATVRHARHPGQSTISGRVHPSGAGRAGPVERRRERRQSTSQKQWQQKWK
jgi:hypothetical protein